MTDFRLSKPYSQLLQSAIREVIQDPQVDNEEADKRTKQCIKEAKEDKSLSFDELESIISLELLKKGHRDRMKEKIGPELVTCTVCGNKKSVRVPWQSISIDAGQGKCNWDCPGYMQKPIPSELYPGEKRKDFGLKRGRK